MDVRGSRGRALAVLVAWELLGSRFLELAVRGFGPGTVELIAWA